MEHPTYLMYTFLELFLVHVRAGHYIDITSLPSLILDIIQLWQSFPGLKAALQ